MTNSPTSFNFLSFNTFIQKQIQASHSSILSAFLSFHSLFSPRETWQINKWLDEFE